MALGSRALMSPSAVAPEGAGPASLSGALFPQPGPVVPTAEALRGCKCRARLSGPETR